MSQINRTALCNCTVKGSRAKNPKCLTDEQYSILRTLPFGEIACVLRLAADFKLCLPYHYPEFREFLNSEIPTGISIKSNYDLLTIYSVTDFEV